MEPFEGLLTRPRHSEACQRNPRHDELPAVLPVNEQAAELECKIESTARAHPHAA